MMNTVGRAADSPLFYISSCERNGEVAYGRCEVAVMVVQQCQEGLIGESYNVRSDGRGENGAVHGVQSGSCGYFMIPKRGLPP